MSDYQPVHDDHPVWYNGVKVNNLDFVNTGVGVMIEGIAGWQDGLEVRDVREPKPGQHGEDADSAYMAGRTITISGRVAAASWSALQTAKQTLATTFAPTSAEVLFKVPLATASAPTTVYASTGMANYERVNAKVVEPIAFSDVEGFTQTWQVSLRASDPRIYSDTETTDDQTIASYAGTTATPLKLECALAGNTETYALLQSPAGYATAIRSTIPTAWDTAVGSYTTTHEIVIDGSTRETYLKFPQNSARLLMFSPTWIYRLNEAAGVTADNAEGTAAYDGTINGTPSLNQSGPATDMKSIAFDGVNDSVSRAWADALIPSTEFTFEIWTKSGSGSGYAADYTGGSTTKGFRVNDGSSYVQFESGDGSSLVNHGSFLKTAASWSQFVAVYKAGVWSLYLNGVLVSTLQSTFSEPTSGTYYLGRSNAGTFWTGNISSVAMYPTAFPAAVVSDWYNSGDAQSIVRYKSGAYIQPTTQWPSLSSATTYTAYGNISAVQSYYRTARL